MELGNNIRRLRFENHEMSQEELALAVGVTRQTIHSVERGKFVPSALLAFRIAGFFGKNVEEVFYIIDRQSKSESYSV
ncbi:MAG: helix-turn-helix transcriptional regulator [Bacteroidales bacterium]|nr:helix-turn-helix transcriptional regulator [Bacteroidales bacterium]